jgi:hypothetical protein
MIPPRAPASHLLAPLDNMRAAHSNHGELNLARAFADTSGDNTLARPARRDSAGTQLGQQLMRGAVKVIRTGVTS